MFTIEIHKLFNYTHYNGCPEGGRVSTVCEEIALRMSAGFSYIRYR